MVSPLVLAALCLLGRRQVAAVHPVGTERRLASKVDRRRFCALPLPFACALRAAPASAAAEWSVGALNERKFDVTKKQESSVRIRPEVMLLASDASGTELKLLKVPLGRAAASSFEPEEQLALAEYFADRKRAESTGASGVAAILARSLQKQVDSPASPLKAATVDVSGAAAVARFGRRYVAYDYNTEGCRKLDEDGGCVGASKRVVSAVVTVSLESQARTLEEQRRMDRGDLEARYVDTLWIFTASAPSGKAPLKELRDIAATFSVA
ncbi:hypothetical protein M885DRAFT_511465, partial [Pelagophyceae sp. CCMP2097]